MGHGKKPKMPFCRIFHLPAMVFDLTLKNTKALFQAKTELGVC